MSNFNRNLNGNANGFKLNYPISKFFLCIHIQNYSTSCCFNAFTLKISVTLIALFEMFISILSIPYFLDSTNIIEGIILFVNIISIVPGYFGFKSIRSSDGNILRYYYFWRLFKILFWLFLNILSRFIYCLENYKCIDLRVFMLVIFIISSIELYLLYILFSTANLLLKGETILVNNGIEVVQMISEVKNQNTILPQIEIVKGIPLN